MPCSLISVTHKIPYVIHSSKHSYFVITANVPVFVTEICINILKLKIAIFIYVLFASIDIEQYL